MRDIRDMWDIDDMSTNSENGVWVPNTDTFGSRLALLRHYMRWNIKEAALACNVPAGSWREWELSGRRPHDLDGVCQKIAARTGCDDIWLMTGRRITTIPPSPTAQADSTMGLRITRPEQPAQLTEIIGAAAA